MWDVKPANRRLRTEDSQTSSTNDDRLPHWYVISEDTRMATQNPLNGSRPSCSLILSYVFGRITSWPAECHQIRTDRPRQTHRRD